MRVTTPADPIVHRLAHRFLLVALAATPLARAAPGPRELSVLEHGAVADGSTDDAAAIQRAIDTAIAAGGGRVVLPASPRPYLVRSTLRVHGSRVELHGPGATLRLADGAGNLRTVDVIEIRGRADAPIEDVVVRGLTIDANHVAQRFAIRPRGIDVDHARRVLIDRVTIRRPWVGLTFGLGARDCEARDCVVTGWDNDGFSVSGDGVTGDGVTGDGVTGGADDIRFVRCRAHDALDGSAGGAPGRRDNAWEIEDGATRVRLLECVVWRCGGNAFAVRSHPVGESVTRDVEFNRCQAHDVGGFAWLVRGASERVRVERVRLVDCVSRAASVLAPSDGRATVEGCFLGERPGEPLPPRLRLNYHAARPGSLAPEPDQHLVPLLSPLVLENGETVSSADEWRQRRRPELVRLWTEVLGKIDPAPADRVWFGDITSPVVGESREEDGYTRIELELAIERDFRQPHLLLLPRGQGEGPFPAVIAWTSTSPDYRQPETWWGAWLARRGFVVLTGWSFIRHYRGGATYASGAHRAVYDRFGHWLPMAKMVHDVRREIEYLRSRPDVDASRIGFIGFSLSAKAALYVGAFCDEVAATVSIDPHVAINGNTNYHDPWYLDWRRRFPGIATRAHPDPELRGTVQALLDADPARPGLERNHHELMALCAPRSFLLIGCSMDREGGAAHSDDRQSWSYFNRAREVYELLGVPERLEILAVGGGHRPTGPEIDRAWQRFFQRWLGRHE